MGSTNVKITVKKMHMLREIDRDWLNEPQKHWRLVAAFILTVCYHDLGFQILWSMKPSHSAYLK